MAVDVKTYAHWFYSPKLSKNDIKYRLGLLKNGTKEWVRKGGELNIVGGCLNNCSYCYARFMAHLYNRIPFEEWSLCPKLHDNLPKIPKKISNHSDDKYDFMLPTASDIIDINEKGEPNPQFELYIQYFKEILSHKYTLLITSKPRFSVIQRLCEELEEYQDNITYRFTISSINSALLKQLEPNAPSYEQRLQSVKYATKKGFHTSISIEPLLDSQPHQLYSELSSHLSSVDLIRDRGTIWLGLLKTKYTPTWFREKYNLTTLYQTIQENQSFENTFAWYKDFVLKDRIRMKESVLKLMLTHNVRINSDIDFNP